MDLIQLIIGIAIIGVLLWAINKYVPMDPQVNKILNIVVVVALVIYILLLFSGYMPNIRIGR